MEEKPAKIEGVSCVYKNGDLFAIVKRDEKSRKNIIYKVQEADLDEIVSLINSNQTIL